MKDLDVLQNNIGYTFNNKDLLLQALSHSSYTNKANSTTKKNIKHASNERMEFLGDKVLGLVIAEHLYLNFPNKKEGELSSSIAYLNSGRVLYSISEKINIQEFLFLQDANCNNMSTKNICADAVEALIGAIFLDSNYIAVKDVIIKFWLPFIEKSFYDTIKAHFNPKSLLQEWAQKNNLGLPEYKFLSKEGYEHTPIFHVSLDIKGYDTIFACGNTKKNAQKEAALIFVNKHNLLGGK